MPPTPPGMGRDVGDKPLDELGEVGKKPFGPELSGEELDEERTTELSSDAAAPPNLLILNGNARAISNPNLRRNFHTSCLQFLEYR